MSQPASRRRYLSVAELCMTSSKTSNRSVNQGHKIAAFAAHIGVNFITFGLNKDSITI